MDTQVHLTKINEEYTIVDLSGKVIISDILEAENCYIDYVGECIQFVTKKHEVSYITLSGLFFNHFSYKEFDLVSELVYSRPVYRFTKDGKYGIIEIGYGENRILLDSKYDEIKLLESNLYRTENIVVIKLKRGEKYSLMYISKFYIVQKSKEYDFIYTPIQPLNKYIVYKDRKYGFFDVTSSKGIVEPIFDSIEELCNKYNCNIDKYTQDLYITDKKLDFREFERPGKIFVESFFIDVNKISKMEWIGYESLQTHPRTKETYVYSVSLLTNKYTQSLSIPINMYGYFYNLFDSRIYDSVYNIIGRYYLVSKNNKYGLIDDEFHTILGLCYNKINLVKFFLKAETPLFVVSSQNGDFLFNPETNLRTCEYESLSWCNSILHSYNRYLVYKENGKYGIIAPNGEIITKARFDIFKYEKGDSFIDERLNHAYFQDFFHNEKYAFYIQNNKFYGVFPIDEYESCIGIGYGLSELHFFIVRTGGKYGLFNSFRKQIKMPLMEDIIFPKNSMFNAINDYSRNYINISETFLVGKNSNKYSLYSIQDIKYSDEATLIISDCEDMNIIEEENIFTHRITYPYIHYVKNGIQGYVNEDGEIINTEIYSKIQPILNENGETCFYKIYKDGKCGLLNKRMKILLPCRYEEISDITNKEAVITLDGIQKIINYKLTTFNQNSDYNSDEIQHYGKFSGSYAQDEMGYSDEDIDIIFEGDPDAYWNID